MPRQSETTLAAIKQAVDLIALVGEYLPLHRSGSKFKALCPFHDDHNPSLLLNPEHQSFKCWSCGAGGDVFDFVQRYERVEFPEALRMLADRAGITLEQGNDRSTTADAAAGPSKSELLATAAWAEGVFTADLNQAAEAPAYLEARGLNAASIARFRIGYAVDQRDWLQRRARRDGRDLAALEQVGLVARNPETNLPRDRFRGRLIFPIHDQRGRTLGFGGRILPSIEKKWSDQGHRVAKYVNSPETPLFQKRRTLFAADLARAAARQEGWVIVVEGYTDVIAAHQVGIENVVGTLGTALGDDHITALRRLADRVVLVFDGDEAGQKAAERALELFLGHEVEVRVLTLPAGQDPCDFLLAEGGPEAFRLLVHQAVDPLNFAIDRVAARFDIDSPEGARQAAQTVLAILGRVPSIQRGGLELKVAKALDMLARRLRVPVSELQKGLRRSRRPAARPAGEPATAGDVSESEITLLRPADFDRFEREVVTLALIEPAVVPTLRAQLPADTLHEAPLRAILQACYDLAAEGRPSNYERISLRLEDPAVRALAAGLLLPIEPGPLLEDTLQGSVESRLTGILVKLAERQRRQRLADLQAAKNETDPLADPDAYRELQREYLRVLNQRPDSRKVSAS